MKIVGSSRTAKASSFKYDRRRVITRCFPRHLENYVMSLPNEATVTVNFTKTYNGWMATSVINEETGEHHE